MKRFMRWLEAISSRPKEPVADDRPSNADPDDLGLPKDIQDFVTDAPMPDMYIDENDATVPHLKTLDPDSPDTDKSDEFDPDDTVVLQKK